MLLTLGDLTPKVHPEAWVAANATLAGNVTIETSASIWYSAVLRAENAGITVGARSNVQDCCVLHAGGSLPITLGANVTVGHGAVLHGCSIDDDVLIGVKAVILDGARIERGSVVAAGALVPEGMTVPRGMFAIGSPARIQREVSAREFERLKNGAASYVDLSGVHRTARERPSSPQ